jgi:hypothetical protein
VQTDTGGFNTVFERSLLNHIDIPLVTIARSIGQVS